MNSITQNAHQDDKPDTERIERFHSLSGGQYWKANNDIVGHPIHTGDVLLIESIKWVDNLPHTIVLRTHPDIYDRHVQYIDTNGRECGATFKYHRFLVADFVRNFEYEPDYQRIRTEEMAAVNAEVAKQQQLLINAQVNPDILNQVVADELAKEVKESKASANLPMGSASLEYSPEVIATVSGTLSNAIGTGITESSIEEMKGAANRELKIAQIKFGWMKSQTELIAKTIQRLTPYFHEQAAASFAQSEDAMSHIRKLITGIESLDLYVGKNVSIVNYKKGQSAPPDVKLTICQKKLFMDEELAVWADVDHWFDFSNIDDFFETLAQEQGLLNQVFPTERCILVMASNNRYIDYGDRYANMARNKINKDVLLAVRDGENIYTVQSPVESHMGTDRLFPSKSEQDRIFRGLDGSAIKFTDLDYTSALASHEAHALHYKRFLILLCGLDHRENLFGDFYTGPKDMNFVSMAFQENNFNFLHDDDGEGLLSHVNKPSLTEFIKTKNSVLQSGSRVICHWRELMDSTTAPGAVKLRETHHSGRSLQEEVRYRPDNKYDTVIARKKGKSLVVDIPVKATIWSNNPDRTFNCLVNLSEYKGNTVGYLCLDDVDPEDLQWYINARSVRGDFLQYMQTFKAAVKYLREERERETESRQWLSDMLMDGKIVSTPADAMDVVNRAVIGWRAANRGDPLPLLPELKQSGKPYKELLELMYQLAGNAERQIEPILAYCGERGISVVRAVIGKRSKLQVYAEPLPEELDNRASPFSWVHKITFKTGRNGLMEASRNWAVLQKTETSETVLFENADLVAKWSAGTQVFKSPAHKQNVLGVPELFVDRINGLLDRTPSNAAKVASHFLTVRTLISPIGTLRVPTIILPFAAFTTASGDVSYLCAVCKNSAAYVKSLLTGKEQLEFIEAFSGSYMDESRPKTILSLPVHWNLESFDSNQFDFESEIFFDTAGVYMGALSDQKPKINPSFDLWLSNAFRKSKTLSNSIYLPTDCGTPLDTKMDSILGITRPENFSPVACVKYSISISKVNSRKPVDLRFIDIYPFSEGEDLSKKPLEMVKHSSKWSASYGHSTTYFVSEQAALDGIAGEYIPYNEDEMMDYVKPPLEGGKRYISIEHQIKYVTQTL